MSESMKVASGGDAAPPILLRRRLSAPETIMRKYLLAQQSSSSKDRLDSEPHKFNCSCSGGSDPNLLHRNELDYHKSTLIQKFWENSKGLANNPKTYSEWLYSFGKMKSTSSSNSSVLSFNYSLKHIDTLQKNKVKLSVSGSLDQDSSLYFRYNSKGNNKLATDFNKLSEIEEESKNENNRRDSNKKKIKFLQKEIICRKGNYGECGQSKKHFPVFDKAYPKIESSTETIDTTNINVITNVPLSQSSLNVIFDSVSQDVIVPLAARGHSESNCSVNLSKFGQVNKISSDPAIEKDITNSDSYNYAEDMAIISEVNMGTYINNSLPSLRRLSALPRTVSMEVNTSLNDSIEKDISASSGPQDSLEDGNIAQACDDENLVKENKRASAFYIPVDDSYKKLEQNVSDALPDKLKEKLLQRHKILQSKKQDKIKREFQTAKIIKPSLSSLSFQDQIENRRFAGKCNVKTVLPKINSKHKSVTKSIDKNTSLWAQKTKKNTSYSKWKGRESHAYDQQHQKRDSESSNSYPKQIEILEIMEVTEPDLNQSQLKQTRKSRIPVLRNSNFKLPSLRPKKKDTDFCDSSADPKLDQLIANILIDTLKNPNTNEIIEKATNKNVNVRNASTYADLDETATSLTKHVLNNNNVDTLKIAEHVRDMNYMTSENYPQGRITFYMLQENQSQTSDP